MKTLRFLKMFQYPTMAALCCLVFFSCGSMSTGTSGGSSYEKEDATVSGTNYNATGNIPCNMGSGQTTGNCKFGVIRKGNGNADVYVTKPNGAMRVINFQGGNAVGYDRSQADRGEFSASKEADLYIIRIGSERYEIPEPVVFGG